MNKPKKNVVCPKFDHYHAGKSRPCAKKNGVVKAWGIKMSDGSLGCLFHVEKGWVSVNAMVGEEVVRVEVREVNR